MSQLSEKFRCKPGRIFHRLGCQCCVSQGLVRKTHHTWHLRPGEFVTGSWLPKRQKAEGAQREWHSNPEIRNCVKQLPRPGLAKGKARDGITRSQDFGGGATVELAVGSEGPAGLVSEQPKGLQPCWLCVAAAEGDQPEQASPAPTSLTPWQYLPRAEHGPSWQGGSREYCLQTPSPSVTEPWG